MLGYLYRIGIWLSIGANVVLLMGSPYESCSERIGRNMLRQGVMRRVYMPRWFKRHCLAAANVKMTRRK